MDQSRLHGVEIDQAQSFAAFRVEQHVVQLGVAVYGPDLQFPALAGGFQNAEAVPALRDEIQRCVQAGRFRRLTRQGVD